MKSSDLEKAAEIMRRMRRYKAIELMTFEYPRKTGYLDIGDRNMPISPAQVDLLMEEELRLISDEAAAIGLEFDE